MDLEILGMVLRRQCGMLFQLSQIHKRLPGQLKQQKKENRKQKKWNKTEVDDSWIFFIFFIFIFFFTIFFASSYILKILSITLII